MENLESLGNPKDCQDRVDFESDVGNSVTDRCYWHNDIGTRQPLGVVKRMKMTYLS